MNLGINVKRNTNEVKVTRVTKETKISVSVNSIREKSLDVDTTIPFFNHMIETLAWRACLNIGVQLDTEMKLNHPIAEDAGITLGCAILELYKSKMPNGIEGFGFARGIIDEAFADVAISIEGRINHFIDGITYENVEGTNRYDLIAFLEGFCQGCKCTLRVNYSGNDPHHSWEAVFRALGFAIRKAMEPNYWRKGTISAMKRTLE